MKPFCTHRSHLSVNTPVSSGSLLITQIKHHQILYTYWNISLCRNAWSPSKHVLTQVFSSPFITSFIKDHRMLSAARCSLSTFGSQKLKMTLVFICAIQTVYPGPVFKFPATNVESVFSGLRFFHRIWTWVQVCVVCGCEFENLNCWFR